MIYGVLGIGSQWKLWRALVGSESVVLDFRIPRPASVLTLNTYSVFMLWGQSQSHGNQTVRASIYTHTNTHPAEIRHWRVCVCVCVDTQNEHSSFLLHPRYSQLLLEEEILHRTSSLLRVSLFPNSFAALTFLHDCFCYCTFKAYIGFKQIANNCKHLQIATCCKSGLLKDVISLHLFSDAVGARPPRWLPGLTGPDARQHTEPGETEPVILTKRKIKEDVPESAALRVGADESAAGEAEVRRGVLQAALQWCTFSETLIFIPKSYLPGQRNHSGCMLELEVHSSNPETAQLSGLFYLYIC